jgi:hypothetical protein
MKHLKCDAVKESGITQAYLKNGFEGGMKFGVVEAKHVL